MNLGGYIDNVQGTFTLDPNINEESAVDLGPDATYDEARNADLAEDNFNDSFYKGIRLGVYHEFNPDWNVLVQNTYQELGADGVFDYDPEVGDLQVERFFPDELRDKFNQTSWTVEGRAGMLDLIYTGGICTAKSNSRWTIRVITMPAVSSLITPAPTITRITS